MSKIQDNSSFYDGRYLQLYDQKTKNNIYSKKSILPQSTNPSALSSLENSPLKQIQTKNFQNKQLSIQEQLTKMSSNHNMIMEMIQGINSNPKQFSINPDISTKYDSFNPQKYADIQLFSGRKEKNINELQKEYYQGRYINNQQENQHRANFQANKFNASFQRLQKIQPKILELDHFNNDMKSKELTKDFKGFSPSLNSNFNSNYGSYNNSRKNLSQIKTETQYYNYNENHLPLKEEFNVNNSGKKLNQEVTITHQQNFRRPHTQYIRMPQSFNQQFPQFFIDQHHSNILPKPQSQSKLQSQLNSSYQTVPSISTQPLFQLKPSSPQLIVNRPSIPRIPKTTLGSCKKLNLSSSKPILRQKSRQRSNSKQRKLNLSINTINDCNKSVNGSVNNMNVNNNMNNSGNIPNQYIKLNAPIQKSKQKEKIRRPSTGGGIFVTLNRK